MHSLTKYIGGHGTSVGDIIIDSGKFPWGNVNTGDAKSLACHPASTNHQQLNQTELAKAGVIENLVRLSVGIERIDDIITDIDQALEQV